jgi:hypothetical protein
LAQSFFFVYLVSFFKYNDLCINIWKCFSNDDDDEYDEDQHNILERIQQIRQQFDQTRSENERQRDIHSSLHEQLRISLGRLIDILVRNLNKNKIKIKNI